MSNGLINTFFFNTENECLDFAKTTSNLKFLISKHDNKINFVDSIEWNSEKKQIEFNIEKAKKIKQQEFRFLRQNKFDKLDAMYMKAFQLNQLDIIEKILKLKQDLRDITSVQMPDDIDELANFIPSIFSEIDSLSI
jgi:hypothetical protein